MEMTRNRLHYKMYVYMNNSVRNSENYPLLENIRSTKIIQRNVTHLNGNNLRIFTAIGKKYVNTKYELLDFSKRIQCLHNIMYKKKGISGSQCVKISHQQNSLHQSKRDHQYRFRPESFPSPNQELTNCQVGCI